MLNKALTLRGDVRKPPLVGFLPIWVDYVNANSLAISLRKLT
jgi:hypothetical protein